MYLEMHTTYVSQYYVYFATCVHLTCVLRYTYCILRLYIARYVHSIHTWYAYYGYQDAKSLSQDYACRDSSIDYVSQYDHTVINQYYASQYTYNMYAYILYVHQYNI